VVTANTKSDDIAVFLNTGDWGFNKPRYMDAGPRPTDLAFADIDGDGRPDLLVGIADGVQALLNRGNGVFEKSTRIAVPGRRAIAAADFDGDGAVDFTVFDGGSGTIALHRNEKSSGPGTVASSRR